MVCPAIRGRRGRVEAKGVILETGVLACELVFAGCRFWQHSGPLPIYMHVYTTY